MISEIQIENFKSIAKLTLKLGHVTVLIGENGSGKSNILEAIGFAAAACTGKLDDEFLHTRGIRVTEQEWMLSKFVPKQPLPGKRKLVDSPISFKISSRQDVDPLSIKISRSMGTRVPPGSTWHVYPEPDPPGVGVELDTSDFLHELEILRNTLSNLVTLEATVLEKVAREMVAQRLATAKKRKMLPTIAAIMGFRDFLVYSPENTALRRFEDEGAIKPLGTKGEGLLKLLSDTAALSNGKFTSELKSLLSLFGWFDDLQLPNEEDEIRGRLRIKDRWLPDHSRLFDQRSANEGFLYLLFYFTLFSSEATPRFFAIDNIDNSLNPKLCAQLIRHLSELSERTGKQVILTTHNPAILDGLNLHPDKQRLYVVRRNSEGHTEVNPVNAPRPRADGPPVKLSTAFMSGLLGGLPDHF